jgi:hypothetical protein
MYFCLLHNQGGRLYIIRTIGQVLCVLLFMNGFMPYVLIAILIFLGSSANSGFRESMFCHCVASAGCLINPSPLCFSLCHRNNSDSFLFANQRTNQRMIGKYQKHLFRSALCSVAVLIITTIFSTVESIESTNRALSRS